MAARFILDFVEKFHPEETRTSSRSKASQLKLCHLPNDILREVILRDCRERKSLVTADFTHAIYDDACRFKDGSGLDGAYPMEPWVLGCKLLFDGSKSKAIINEESLVVTASHIAFRFESDLEFRGPFKPSVHLTGSVIMAGDARNGLITSYQEKWDQNVIDIVAQAEHHPLWVTGTRQSDSLIQMGPC